jgi:hypothetical protein
MRRRSGRPGCRETRREIFDSDDRGSPRNSTRAIGSRVALGNNQRLGVTIERGWLQRVIADS